MTGPWGVVGIAVLAMVLWTLVVWLHGRRDARRDLTALDAAPDDATEPELDAARRAWARTDLPRPGGSTPPGSSSL